MNEFDAILLNAKIPKPSGYHFYFKNYIFNGIDLGNKNLLDLGGGNGIASFFALYQSSSCNAWVVDPIAEGSNQLMTDQFNHMKESFGKDRINYHRDFIDSLEEPNYFDIVLMHNSINHIGEDLIEKILTNQEEYSEYVERIKKITGRLKPGGTLVVADCGRNNFWDDVGLKSPFAPTIEWKLHREPDTWKKMIEEAGLVHINTKWTARRELRSIGKTLLGNRLCSYLLGSHFVSMYRKV